MSSSTLLILIISVSICVAVDPTCTNNDGTGFCYEICTSDGDQHAQCINRKVDFSKATEGSGIDCRDDDTCINITLVCPINSTIQSSSRYNCEIRGYNTIYQSHENWTIIAPNSWSDLTITNFNVFMQGTMFCKESSCDIQYGLWNCKDPSNQCFYQRSNTNYIHCNNDQQCQQDTISCPDSEEGEDNSICNIICNGVESCIQSTINCGARSQCNVLCVGEESCKETIINCPTGSTQECNIICGSIDASGSCTDIVINSYENRANTNIFAMGLVAMENAKIIGPRYNDLIIQCNNLQSCDTMTVFANESNVLNIGCNYADNTNNESSSCQNMHIYCPTDGQNCFISGSTYDIHADLQIFAKGGWDDIVISDEYKETSKIDVDGTSTLHCGDKAFYDSSCLISEDWYCECPSMPTVSGTNIPTMDNGNMTTTQKKDDGLDERSKTGYIVGGILVGLCVLAFIGTVYWYCCIHHKPIDSNNNEQYEMVKGDDIEDNGVNDGVDNGIVAENVWKGTQIDVATQAAIVDNDKTTDIEISQKPNVADKENDEQVEQKEVLDDKDVKEEEDDTQINENEDVVDDEQDTEDVGVVVDDENDEEAEKKEDEMKIENKEQDGDKEKVVEDEVVEKNEMEEAGKIEDIEDNEDIEENEENVVQESET